MVCGSATCALAATRAACPSCTATCAPSGRAQSAVGRRREPRESESPTPSLVRGVVLRLGRSSPIAPAGRTDWSYPGSPSAPRMNTCGARGSPAWQDTERPVAGTNERWVLARGRAALALGPHTGLSPPPEPKRSRSDASTRAVDGRREAGRPSPLRFARSTPVRHHLCRTRHHAIAPPSAASRLRTPGGRRRQHRRRPVRVRRPMDRARCARIRVQRGPHDEAPIGAAPQPGVTPRDIHPRRPTAQHRSLRSAVRPSALRAPPSWVQTHVELR